MDWSSGLTEHEISLILSAKRDMELEGFPISDEMLKQVADQIRADRIHRSATSPRNTSKI
jgi:hypothetical protein